MDGAKQFFSCFLGFLLVFEQSGAVVFVLSIGCLLGGFCGWIGWWIGLCRVFLSGVGCGVLRVPFLCCFCEFFNFSTIIYF
jgi:hypothetical protein